MNDENNRTGEWKEWSKHVLIEIQRLNDEQKTLSDEQRTMSTILAVNTKQLEIHIEGVRLARDQNELLRKDVDAKVALLAKEVDVRVGPLESRDVEMKAIMWTVAKVIAFIFALPAAAGVIIKLIDLFHK